MTSSTTEAFNNDELEAPQWMDADFFTQVLQQSSLTKNENGEAGGGPIEVTGYKMTPATAKGDHYASIMFRAAVDYREGGVVKSKSLIIKTMPDVEGHKADLLKEAFVFKTEIGMYTTVLPRFEQMLRDVGDETVLGARCLFHSLAPKEVIVFEDLVEQDYVVLRDRNPDLEEVKIAYMKLAKLHACSYKLLSEEPEFFKQYRYSLFTITTMVEQPVFTDGIKVFNTMLDSMPEYSEYKPYFASLEQDLLKNCIAGCQEYHENPQPGAYYVLCHGDFHFKNMMYKHNANKTIQDVMLLDYQMSAVGPMAWDLIYSIFMLLDTEMRAKHFDALLAYYFENFVATLKKIGFKGPMPQFMELKKQIRRHKQFEIFLMVTFLPMWYGWTTTIDTDQMITSAEYRNAFYTGQKYLEDLKQLLPKYKNLGYFNEN